METKQDLLNRIEELKQKTIELEKRNEEELYSIQRNSITEKFRELLEMPDCSEASIWAVIVSMLPFNHPFKISYYAKESDKNTLLKEKLINRFAREQEIRYEDSLNVIKEFIFYMKPINKELPENMCEKYERVKHNDKVNPIFYK